MLRRRPKIEESENHERWLVSYADFITLLFAFFVVMYSISQVNEGKYRVVSESLVTAFDTQKRSFEPIQIGEINRNNAVSDLDNYYEDYGKLSQNSEGIEDKGALSPKLISLEKDISLLLNSLIKADLASVKLTQDWLEIDLRSGLLFRSGSANLSESAGVVIAEISNLLNTNEQLVRVRGHTDSLPIFSDSFRSNWELSTARAASVVKIMQQNNVNPLRMAVEGYGEFQPIASNETPEGRAKNRRVVLAISAQSLIEEDRLNTTNTTEKDKTSTQNNNISISSNQVINNVANAKEDLNKKASQQKTREEALLEQKVEIIRSARGGLLIKAKSSNENEEP
ncbi:MAG: flagellar motor protein MotD [Pseudomonadota bacterium]